MQGFVSTGKEKGIANYTYTTTTTAQSVKEEKLPFREIWNNPEKFECVSGLGVYLQKFLWPELGECVSVLFL